MLLYENIKYNNTSTLLTLCWWP